MKKSFILILMAALLCACDDGPASMDFSVQKIAPFTYQFTNLSSRMDGYKWDFGDGSYSLEKDATHKYAASDANYIVTLTGTKNGVKYDCRRTLVVKKPNIYISGWGLNKIPFSNMYYKMACEDNNVLSKDIKFHSQYTPLLDNSDIPYTYISPNKVLLNPSKHAYYTFYVYYTWNNSTTNNDQLVLKMQLTREQILTYQPQQVLNNGDALETELVVLFDYE